MPVTVAVKRTGKTDTVSTTQEFCTATLTGTYATGGFTFNPYSILGGPGSSPVSGTRVLAAMWLSPLGYTYSTTVNGTVATTKILTAPNVEFTNATAVPEASVPLILTKSKV